MPPRGLVSILAVLILTLGLLPMLSLWDAEPAEATYASGGSGKYKGDIDWLSWGNHDSAVTNGMTATTTQTVGGEVLSTVCTINNIAGTTNAAVSLRAYRSGTWKNDGLDDLYNIGGVNNNNQLIAGLGNPVDGDTVNFTISCVARLDGVQVPLSGLVLADAEASNAKGGEYISARPTPDNAAWRIIERYRDASCPTANSVSARLATDGTLRLSPTANECAGGGPMAIAYMQGATSAAVTLKGEGKSAVALGVVLATDFGDAPDSYGSAGSLYQPSWSGTKLPVGTTNVWNLVLPTQIQPPTRLGATIDSDGTHLPSAKASLDDTTNLDDEDAVADLGTVNVHPTQSYTLPNVQCAGPGFVAGWMDWNANGKFDTGERSAPVQCTGSSVSLGWTVPADVKSTPGDASGILRLRIAAASAELSSAVGMTTTGEVEDHPVTINVPNLGVQKNIQARAAATDQFSLSLRNTGGVLGAATTSGAETGVQASQIQPVTVLPGTTYTFTESMAPGSPSPTSNYTSTSQCTLSYLNGTSQSLPAQNGTTGTITVPAYNAALGHPAIKCVFSNGPRPATLTATKSWIVDGRALPHGTQPEGLSAQAEFAHGGSTKRPAWGTAETGYFTGDQIAVNESTQIAAAMPGCTLDSQRVTGANGSTPNAALPYTLTAQPGANTVAITNTVTCKSTLTLNKEVRSGGTATPADWTLNAYPGNGPAIFTGTTGVSGEVMPGTALQLAESAGNPLYVQDDQRTEAERSATPRATGSWTCVALDGSGRTVRDALSARTGVSGTVVPALGSHTSCTAVNRTARLSILKFVENLEDSENGTATPADWNLSAAPRAGVNGLESGTVAGSMKVSTESTIQVRPGHGYDLSEDGALGGYLQVGLELFTGVDSSDTAALANAANWKSVNTKEPVAVGADEHQVYRFVNREAAAFELPLTGGGGSLPYVLVGGLVVFLALGAGALYKRLNQRKNHH